MSTPFETQPWPVELRYKSAEKALEIDFDDDLRCSLPAELLRVESPSAEVMGHGEGKTIVPGRRHVGITLIEPVGNYAVRLHFDDLHTTGIYTWTYLRHLAESRDAVWRTYLDALEEPGYLESNLCAGGAGPQPGPWFFSSGAKAAVRSERSSVPVAASCSGPTKIPVRIPSSPLTRWKMFPRQLSSSCRHQSRGDISRSSRSGRR